MIVFVPLLVALVGLIVFLVAKGDLKQIGFALFCCGTLATCLGVASGSWVNVFGGPTVIHEHR